MIRASYERVILNDYSYAELQDIEYSLWKLHYKQSKFFNSGYFHVDSDYEIPPKPPNANSKTERTSTSKAFTRVCRFTISPPPPRFSFSTTTMILTMESLHMKHVQKIGIVEDEELVDGKVDWRGRTAVRHKHGGMKVSLLVLGAFAFENMATLSLAVNLVSYFTGIMHYELSDAANMVPNYTGVSYMLSIVVDVLVDTLIGRYKSVVLSGSIECLGLALLAIQTHYRSLKPTICNLYDKNAVCKKIKGNHEAFLLVGRYLLAFASVGLKASLPPHGADQFDERNPKETRQMSSFFNGLLPALCVGGSVSLTFNVWIQESKGWDWGFGISIIAIVFATVTFAFGLSLYRIHVAQRTNSLIEIFQDKEVAMEIEFLPHRDIFRFLDKAAIERKSNGVQSKKQEILSQWKLCRVTQEENAKIILNMIPIFCCTIIMTLCIAQLQIFSVQQGFTMNTKIVKHFNIPSASLPIIPVEFLLILIPFYDQIYVPLLRKLTGIPTGVTHLQRISIELVLSNILMAIVAIIEVKRKFFARDNNMLEAIPGVQPLPLSIFWLSFQYFVFGIADMFTYVELLEFFYSEAPKGLKATSTCFLWCSMAIGYFLSSIMVQLINRATKNVTASGGWLAGNNINKNHLNLLHP